MRSTHFEPTENPHFHGVHWNQPRQRCPWRMHLRSLRAGAFNCARPPESLACRTWLFDDASNANWSEKSESAYDVGKESLLALAILEFAKHRTPLSAIMSDTLWLCPFHVLLWTDVPKYLSKLEFPATIFYATLLTALRESRYLGGSRKGREWSRTGESCSFCRRLSYCLWKAGSRRKPDLWEGSSSTCSTQGLVVAEHYSSKYVLWYFLIEVSNITCPNRGREISNKRFLYKTKKYFLLDWLAHF